MADGIRINDAAIEISPASLEAIVKKQGANLTLTHLDITISPEALNTLLTAMGTEERPAPSAALSDGRMQVTAEAKGKRMSLDLRAGSLRLEITGSGLRLKSE